MRVYGIVKEREKKTRILFVCLAIVLTVLEILQRGWIYLPLCALVFFACFFKKEQVVSEEGISINYNVFSFRSSALWNWDEITTLHTDYEKKSPHVMVHIGKDIMTRTFVVTRQDCKKILDLARKMNPNIYIVDEKKV